jgi:hypothetical protein
VLKKVIFYYTRKHEIVKKKIDYDLKLLSFKKTKQEIHKELRHFKNHIFKKMMKKKIRHVLGQLLAFIITSCKKNYSKIHSYEKVFFGKKNIRSFFKVITLVRYISFAPNRQ